MAKAKFEIDYRKLCDAMRRDRLVLEPFRQNLRDMVKQYAGKHYSRDASQKEVPFNLLAQFVEIVAKSLVPKNPRVMLSTFDRSQKATLDAMQAWANREIEKMRLADTLQRIVIDAMFSIGIAKVALATPGDAASTSWDLGAGQPFIEHVDLDDWGYDTNATKFNKASYMFCRYRIPLAVARDMYRKKDRDKLQPTDPSMFNQQGDERIGMIGRGYVGDRTEVEDMVDLWEVYYPRHRAILTLRSDDGGEPTGDDEPLAEKRWIGSDQGPYVILGFGVVPGNAMPKAPIQDLYDMHLAANKTFRKILRTTDRIKEFVYTKGGQDADGNRAMNVEDGQLIRLDHPEMVGQMSLSGTVLQPLMGSLALVDQLFNKQGGNLELLGGRGPQSKTATQDKMLNENAGAGIADKQDKTIDFVSRLMRAWLWYGWNDPHLVQRSTHTVGSAEITREVYPAGHYDEAEMRRLGDLPDIAVDPYSMQHQTPQQKLAGVNQVVTQIVIPLSQLLQAQGIVFDANAWLKIVAQWMDLPELTDLLTIQQPPQPAEGQGGEEPGMPQETTRNYVRESTPGRTDQATGKDFVARMVGGHDMGGAQKNGNGVMAS